MNDHYRIESESFRRYVHDEPIPFLHLIFLGLKSLLGLLEFCIRYLPGGIGLHVRYLYYKLWFKKMGRKVLIDTGVILNGARNISVDDFSWIDTNCRIDAMLGEVKIGRRVHVAPSALIFAREEVRIGNYVGIGAFSRIYASTEVPTGGKRACGPMVPEAMRAVRAAPVLIGDECLIGTGAVVLPGARLGKGAVVGANSVLTKSVDSWQIVGGVPARVIGEREPVNEPEI